MNCEDFIIELQSGIIRNEAKIHARACAACNSLLKSWIYNKEHGYADLPSPERRNILRKNSQQKILDEIMKEKKIEYPHLGGDEKKDVESHTLTSPLEIELLLGNIDPIEEREEVLRDMK